MYIVGRACNSGRINPSSISWVRRREPGTELKVSNASWFAKALEQAHVGRIGKPIATGRGKTRAEKRSESRSRPERD
jgi:hypothetical protein